jgi:acylphosphatase
MPTLKLKIYGKVQGVWYRASTKKVADELGLVGFARNEADGSVTVFAIGAQEDLLQLKKWCQTGTELAEVQKLEEEWGEAEESFIDFQVR